MQRTTSGARLWPVMAVLAFLPFLREKTFADTMGSVPGPAVEGLVPNPDFTRGTEQPVGWKLRGGEGSWRDRSILEIIGTGTGSPHWESDPIPLISGATYRFQMRARQLSGSGCVISGPACANRDYSEPDRFLAMVWSHLPCPRPTSPRSAPPGTVGIQDGLAIPGRRLFPVLPIHRRVKGLVLGEGEMLQSGRYVFRETFGYEGSNYHRALVQATASFNSDCWCFGGNDQVIYRFQVPGRHCFRPRPASTSTIHSGHLPRGGKSRSGKLATPGHGFLRGYSSSKLPALGSATETIFLRVRSPGQAPSFQVNQVDFEAALDGPVPEGMGRTIFAEVPAREVLSVLESLSLDDVSQPGTVRLHATLVNPDKRTAETTLTARIQLPAGARV